MRPVVVAAVLLSGAATVTIAVLPGLRSDYHWPALHVALETAASLIALLAAFLVTGRLRRHRLLSELLLACALVVLALSNLFFETLPMLLAPGPPQMTLWARLAGSSVGALLFAIAAFGPRHRWERRWLEIAAGATGVTAAAVFSAALVGISAVRSPPGARTAPQAVLGPHAFPALPAVELALALLYGLAAAGFLRRSLQLGDEFLGWLAVAAVLAAASKVNSFLHPALEAGSYYTAEAFRLSFCAVLLIGSVREIQSYWRALSEAAVSEERRRIARDLHDGVAQELAYLARNLESLEGAHPETLGRLQRAVDRAQLESRRAIRALAASSRQDLPAALVEAAGEIAERFHVKLEPDCVRDAQLPAVREEALIRIACEAVTNAARHSGADRVQLSLTRDGQQVRLRVRDAGRGFQADAPVPGFGLVSMRERARSVGGDLRISSAPGRGTEVEVAL